MYGTVTGLGGRVTLDSRPGDGTTVRLTLPLSREAQTPAPADAGAGVGAAGSETILVVEDEPAVRDLVRRILSDSGYQVLTASGPSEVESRVAQHAGTIALLVTDVVMPEASGKELAERLARRSPGLRVLYMSGYAPDMMLRRGLALESVAFLAKPFTGAAMLGAVRRAIDGPAVGDGATNVQKR